ncbi:MAG: hypothetical protein M0R66_06975 [Candidatus Omnitrophica bacterium]|nr:hypothetical protein [Candidatus Omnitrophota bacterium]
MRADAPSFVPRGMGPVADDSRGVAEVNTRDELYGRAAQMYSRLQYLSGIAGARGGPDAERDEMESARDLFESVESDAQLATAMVFAVVDSVYLTGTSEWTELATAVRDEILARVALVPPIDIGFGFCWSNQIVHIIEFASEEYGRDTDGAMKRRDAAAV